jgi:HSP20 family molecular chaperone IbpA
MKIFIKASLLHVLFLVGIFIAVPLTAEEETLPDKQEQVTHTDPILDLQRRLFEGLTDENLFRNLENRMGAILEEFSRMDEEFEREFQNILEQRGSIFERFFQQNPFHQFLDQVGVFGQMEHGDFEWIETPEERLLIARLDLSEGVPLDINISDGQIRFTGESRVETVTEGPFGESRSVRVQRFDRSLPIPEDCDPDQVSFENEDGKIIVRFPKRKGAVSRRGELRI